MRTSDEINEVAAALAEAQGALRPASRAAVNAAYKSKYADLASVWEACREALPRLGLAVIQDVTNAVGGVEVTTRITHKSGQWIECGPLMVPMARPDAHGLGSAVSYGKRYALSAALGVVAEEDDDGNGATGRDRVGRAIAEEQAAADAYARAQAAQKPVAAPQANQAAIDTLRAQFGEAAAAVWSPDELAGIEDGIAPTGGMTMAELFQAADDAGIPKSRLTLSAKTLFGVNRWKIADLTDEERAQVWAETAGERVPA